MDSTLRETLEASIRTIPDYPKPGILFRDITTMLGDARAFRRAVDELVHPYSGTGIRKVAGIEARGFILGGAMAHQLSCGFVPIRKPGKLPAATESITYGLEYGTDSIEIHRDALPAGAKVLMVDDLLATGGTMRAACELVEKVGGDITGVTCLIELTDLGGRQQLASYDVHAVISY